MKRKIAILVTLAFVLALVIGSVPQHTSAQGGVEIIIWMTGGDNDAIVTKAAAAPWEAATGNTVTVEAVDWGTAHARILTAATSGEGPDIITGGLSWGIEFGELGGMIDLAAAYPDDVAAIQATDNESIWAAIESVNGEVYGVPWDLTIFLMFSRPDLLAEMGLEVPQTWDELLAYQEAVTEAKGEGGWVSNWGNTEWVTFSSFLWQAGADYYDADCNVTLDSDEAVTALEYFASLYEAGATTEAPDFEAGLNSGLYPAAYGGNWPIGGLDANYPDMVGKWQVSPLAAGPNDTRTAFIGGRVMGIMSYSKNADVAFDMIKYFQTAEAQQALIDESVKLNTLWIPPQTEFLQYVAYGDNVREAVAAQLEDAQAPPNCPGWEASAPAVTEAIQSVIFEGADAEDALADAADSIRDNQ
ncbi:MAG: extracellular solute-binding protein [Chloroflexi bacterium]|nr:extracellular solute-binding protein [Chloroflexota bacterium]